MNFNVTIEVSEGFELVGGEIAVVVINGGEGASDLRGEITIFILLEGC